jgi:hypothetical protein
VLKEIEAVGVAKAAGDVGEGGEEIEFSGQARAPDRA